MTAELATVSRPEDIAALPVEQRGAVITRALVESKSWLAVATKGTDPTPIAEFKAWAATVAEMTRQKGLANEIQLDALEMVRRAERGIGVAIRNGQEAGEIAGRYVGGPSRPYVRNGKTVNAGGRDGVREPKAISPSGFFSNGEETSQTYAMTDGVSDEIFDEAVNTARAEGNLSRANTIRKIAGAAGPLSRAQKADRIRAMAAEGVASRQMVNSLGTSAGTIRDIAREYNIDIRADRVIGKTHVIDPDRVVSSTVYALEGLRQGLGVLTPEDLDALNPEFVEAWRQSLTESVRALRNLIKELTTRA